MNLTQGIYYSMCSCQNTIGVNTAYSHSQQQEILIKINTNLNVLKKIASFSFNRWKLGKTEYLSFGDLYGLT